MQKLRGISRPLYNRGHEKARFFPTSQKFFEFFCFFAIDIGIEAKETILQVLYTKNMNKSIASNKGKKIRWYLSRKTRIPPLVNQSSGLYSVTALR